MAKGAAFFDLDRTILRGASGPTLGDALREVGLISGQPLPGQGLMFKFFDLFGETRPSMWITRQGARLAKGWDRGQVEKAGQLAAPRLAEAVLPYAKVLITEHREAGRPVVLTTTTPYDLIRPFVDEMGLDDVVATRYGVEEGRYDGTIDGEFVWGRGKLRAVREWADGRQVDLRQSYAYSDSYYDRPLLSAVGHPTAVNADPRLMAMAAARRWPSIHLDVPPGVPKFAGLEPQQVLMILARPELFPFVRFRLFGAQNIPQQGPAIIVANHRSYFDPLAVGMALAQRGRPVRGLGKKEVFDAPVVGEMAKALGGIRVDRATGSEEPLVHAKEALDAGELVMIMPQGTIPRGREFFSPELKGRWGAARLAEAARVPVIPMGMWGTEKVWPRSSRLPYLWNVTNPPVVTVRVGQPVHLEYTDVDEDTKHIMAAIGGLLPPEAHAGHEPTPEELARTYPPGHSPEDSTAEAEHESDRRPGTD
ncbi:MAG: hypothetical protein JJLCMIEE_03044 [Acidimicrobiales bacterium]|nr:MAG: HAD-IB family hydrolase [Actinomycetota bacterium]MBV6509928.1 hypothetical protein [Acidimicrobiales bacterium]RIK08581.1 MAG: HAD-IB family hydrolase [Acidobacteriota bacterium]